MNEQLLIKLESSMEARGIKGYLQGLADKVDEHTTIEDVYSHLALLREVDEAEEFRAARAA